MNDVSIRVRHRAVVRDLIDLLGITSDNNHSAPLEFGEGDEAGGATADLASVLASEYAAALIYGPRCANNVLDKAINDDVLIVEFDTKQVDYVRFIDECFSRMVQLFNAYRATVILDDDLDLDDYERIVQQHHDTGKDVDGRDTVFRINSVNYFDYELCQRAFQLTPSQIAARLHSIVEKSQVFNDGILLVTTSKYITRREIETIHDELSRALRA